MTSGRALVRAGTAAAGLAAAGVVAQAAPAVAAVGPIRRGLWPTYAGRGRPDHVALTFDDGPQLSSTPRFLDLLERWDVRATFFVVGTSVAADPGLARELHARGHELGVHSWRHSLALTQGPGAVTEDLWRTREAMMDATGARPVWYRPPYGVATTSALCASTVLGLQPVLWTCWGRDWTAGATAGSVTRAVRRGRAAGATVLLHDADSFAAAGSWRATLGALPRLLEGWLSSSLTVGPLGDHGLLARSPGTDR